MALRVRTKVQGVGRGAWTLGSTAIAVTSGVAQLIVSGFGRVVLIAIFCLSFVFMCAKMLQLYVSHGIQSLQRDLDECRQILTELVDHASPKCSEEIAVTYHIGVDGAGDYVVDERRTTPDSTILVLPLRLTVSFELGGAPSWEGIEASWWCEEEPTHTLNIVPVEQRTGRQRALAVFRPALSSTTRWGIRYRPEGGLWNPLRTSGKDVLRYHTEPFENRHGITLSSLTVSFVFPPGVTSASVREAQGRGKQESVVQDGSLRVTWNISPAPSTSFFWTITVPAWSSHR
ncbi:hypothetical protein AB0J80_00220 [Actinoplanes sp. NPDC049548]|uniref:hypothetical protein n=1 Tax=Actinoplanes sp. NPDC049548 TaxID=3155152 RepID=UPI00342BDCE3